jgi:hypothetical protein
LTVLKVISYKVIREKFRESGSHGGEAYENLGAPGVAKEPAAAVGSPCSLLPGAAEDRGIGWKCQALAAVRLTKFVDKQLS